MPDRGIRSTEEAGDRSVGSQTGLRCLSSVGGRYWLRARSRCHLRRSTRQRGGAAVGRGSAAYRRQVAGSRARRRRSGASAIGAAVRPNRDPTEPWQVSPTRRGIAIGTGSFTDYGTLRGRWRRGWRARDRGADPGERRATAFGAPRQPGGSLNGEASRLSGRRRARQRSPSVRPPWSSRSRPSASASATTGGPAGR